MEYLKGLIFILIAVNIILTLALVYSDLSGTSFCIIGQGCDVVKTSQYSHIFGISLNYFGLISFLILLIVYFFAYNKKIKYSYFLILSIIGALFALYFLYVQKFIIGQLCGNCTTVDSIAILIAILAVSVYFKDKKNKNANTQ